MSVIERVHSGYVYGRRVGVLARRLAALLPTGASVLDVGCGDGLIARAVLDTRPDLSIRGIDVLVRPRNHIPVEAYDGQRIPAADASVDVVMFVDVLHHTPDPMVLLREASRVARKAILIKDHTQDGLFAGSTLRFMDWVGNARHGVALPYNYWPRQRWLAAFRELGLVTGAFEDGLGLYPWPAKWAFERSLHFVALLRQGGFKSAAPPSNGDAWEAAYLRFETPEQEIAKFTARLRRLGADAWPRDARIVELFCGRGNGLHALHRMGFTRVEGMDLSPTLAAQYRGPGTIHVGDCRDLPLESGSVDIAIVQGGLHHLPSLPDDLARTFAETRRILRPGGSFCAVEPWLTPFLRFAHAVARNPLARRMWSRLDAMQTMIEHEEPVYPTWLAQPQLILGLLRQSFDVELCHFRYGKIIFRGRKPA